MLLFIFFIVFIVVTILFFFLIKKIVKNYKKESSNEVQQSTLNDTEITRLSEYFVNKEEKYLSSLGNGYIMNFIANRTLNRGFAVISDKRVYFRGSCYSGLGNKFKETEEERTVDIKDITGSGFIYQEYIGVLLVLFLVFLAPLAGFGEGVKYVADNQQKFNSYQISLENYQGEADSALENVQWYKDHDPENTERIEFLLSNAEEYQKKAEENQKIINNWENTYLEKYIFSGILAGICLPLIIFCILTLLDYLEKRKTFFQIQYAGGSIAFDVSFYAKAEIEDFQKQLRRAKDLSEETTTVKAVIVEQPVTQASSQNSAADDLRKYAELLKDGLISQEEYDAMKKKILGL